MRFLHFIISHSIFVSLCAAALCYQTFELLHLNVDFDVCKLIFFSTLGSYNLYWMLCRYSFNKKNNISISDCFLNLFLIFLSGVGIFYFLFLKSILILYVLISALLTVSYCFLVLPIFSKQKFNNYGYLKTILLAVTWSFATVVIPAHSLILINPLALFFVWLSRFLFVLMLSIIFDSRDVSIDKMHGISSIATFVSKSSIHAMVTIICIFDIIMLQFISRYFIDPKQSIVLILSVLLSISCYFLTLKKERGYYFYYFVVDGLMLFSAFASYLVSI